MLIDIYLQMEYNGRREAETDGGFQRYVLIQHVLSDIIRERIGRIPFHCRDLTKGVENSILKQAKLK